LFFLPACDRGPEKNAKSREVISVWYHTGRPEETAVIKDQVMRFNATAKDMEVELTLIPEGDYNTQVQAAAADNQLPDLLDLDGPYLANYAWKGHLLPLDNLLNPNIHQDLLPTLIAQGTYKDKLYAVGTFDSGLALYGNRSKLLAAGVRLPDSPEKAWTIAEFNTALAKLAQNDPDAMVLDLRLDYRGEWFTYAFSPLIQSAGGDLIDRKKFLSADTVLNSPQAAAAMDQIRDWFKQGYIDPNTDAASFTLGRVALSWCGHWEYPRYQQALGDELVLLPLPDLGTGSKTAMGSWVWAITRSCARPDLAGRFLNFILSNEEILAMSRANGAIPARRTAIRQSALYKEGGPLHLFIKQLTVAVPRPQTPAYPVITSAFQQVFNDIRHGADIAKTLDRAVEIIDQEITDNKGYPAITHRSQP
jgi:multiple sugar transport system substrate-binding protein